MPDQGDRHEVDVRHNQQARVEALAGDLTAIDADVLVSGDLPGVDHCVPPVPRRTLRKCR
jgi:hypothetical protein